MAKPRRLSVALAAATATLGTVSVVSAPQALAAPGDCAPSHRNYHVRGNLDDAQYATVGLNINACPGQAPSAWSVTKGEEAVGNRGRFAGGEVQGIINNGSISANDRWFDTRIVINQCAPVIHWALEGACYKEAEWTVRYHLVNVGDEVTLDQQILDPAPENAGYNQGMYYLTWD